MNSLYPDVFPRLSGSFVGRTCPICVVGVLHVFTLTDVSRSVKL